MVANREGKSARWNWRRIADRNKTTQKGAPKQHKEERKLKGVRDKDEGEGLWEGVEDKIFVCIFGNPF